MAAMMITTILSPSRFLLSLFIIFLAHSGFLPHLHASHHVYRNLAQTSSSPPLPLSQPYRTSYHFQPPKNWINDPNGPMVYKGLYHLFYQYNPKGAVWGNIVWAHSTSTDLVNWIPHDPAIYPSQQSDINGCWSGSATILPGNKPAILYTGINPRNQQVQNLAWPKNLSDPFLTEWIKSPSNPLMAPNSINRINSSSFRDPTTAWLGPDKRWRVIVGSKRDRRGLAILFRSRDFTHWVQAKHPLHSAPNTGMWECPDFYPVLIQSQIGVDTSVTGPLVKHVLKVSLDDTKHDHYTIGIYNLTQDKYIPDKGQVEGYTGLRYDYGKYYASKTFFDVSKKRRILLGWVNESSSVDDDIKKGWSGIHTIPRTVWLDKNGKQLVQWPIVEIQKLRRGKVELVNKVVKGGSVVEISGVEAAQADVEVSFEASGLKNAEELDPSWRDPQLICNKMSAGDNGGVGPFGLLVLASEGMIEYTAVFFRIFKSQSQHVVLFCSDQSRSSLKESNDKTTYGAFLDIDPVHEKLSLRSLIDHSIVESFAGKGRAVITARVYPTKAVGGSVRLYAFNNGTQDVTITNLSAWSLAKAQIS